MFEAQTYDKVLEEILSRAPDGIDLRQGSIFYDVSQASLSKSPNTMQTSNRCSRWCFW